LTITVHRTDVDVSFHSRHTRKGNGETERHAHNRREYADRDFWDRQHGSDAYAGSR